jgi:hypothetical protein
VQRSWPSPSGGPRLAGVGAGALSTEALAPPFSKPTGCAWHVNDQAIHKARPTVDRMPLRRIRPRTLTPRRGRPAPPICEKFVRSRGGDFAKSLILLALPTGFEPVFSLERAAFISGLIQSRQSLTLKQGRSRVSLPSCGRTRTTPFGLNPSRRSHCEGTAWHPTPVARMAARLR